MKKIKKEEKLKIFKFCKDILQEETYSAIYGTVYGSAYYDIDQILESALVDYSQEAGNLAKKFLYGDFAINLLEIKKKEIETKLLKLLQKEGKGDFSKFYDLFKQFQNEDFFYKALSSFCIFLSAYEEKRTKRTEKNLKESLNSFYEKILSKWYIPLGKEVTETKEKLIEKGYPPLGEFLMWTGERKTITEIVEDCPKAEWLLGLAKRLGVEKRKLILASGLCADTVSHLIKDKRVLKAIKTCISYGNGIGTDKELKKANDEAWMANHQAEKSGLQVDFYASSYASCLNFYYTPIRTAEACSFYEGEFSKKENEQKTLKICKDVLGEEIINQFLLL